MTFQYSKELRQKLIKNFKDEHGVDIDEETANDYLDSLSQLFLIFAKNDNKQESE